MSFVPKTDEGGLFGGDAERGGCFFLAAVVGSSGWGGRPFSIMGATGIRNSRYRNPNIIIIHRIAPQKVGPDHHITLLAMAWAGQWFRKSCPPPSARILTLWAVSVYMWPVHRSAGSYCESEKVRIAPNPLPPPPPPRPT